MRGFTGGRRCPMDQGWAGVPAPAPGLPLRNQHRGLPDRGRRIRGRQGTQHLGHLRRPAGPDRRRQQPARSPATTTTATPRTSRCCKDLGARGYRFSVSWPRVHARRARGRVNETGLDFYDRLVDSLLEAEISPMVTLFHWDLPQALQDDGGWLQPRHDRPLRGVRRARSAAGSATGWTHWIPINEPNVVTMLGHGIGKHAPGLALYFDALWVAHHLLVAHGRAAIALRADRRHQRRLRQQPRADLAGQRQRRRRRGGQAVRRAVERARTSRRCCSAATPPTWCR